MITHPKSFCRLDRIAQGDLYKMFQWRNDPEIFKWCRQNDLLEHKRHVYWHERQSEDPTIQMYIIRIPTSEGPVGVCGLTDMDLINQRAEFSLYIGPEHQSKGYGEDALRLLLWHGFNAYPLNQIWGEVFEGNPAMEMFKKVGFAWNGIREDFYFRGGEFIDAHLISIKRSEFTWNS